MCVCVWTGKAGGVWELVLTDLVGLVLGRIKYIHFDRGTCALRSAREKFYATIEHISDVAI